MQNVRQREQKHRFSKFIERAIFHMTKIFMYLQKHTLLEKAIPKLVLDTFKCWANHIRSYFKIFIQFILHLTLSQAPPTSSFLHKLIT